MFSWLKRILPGIGKRSGSRPSGNPGVAVRGKVGLANAERSWEETFDLVKTLARVLDGLGHEQNMKAIRLIGTEVVPEVHKLQRERAATAG